MADLGEMDADLMGSPSLERKRHQRCNRGVARPQFLIDDIMGCCVPSATGGHGHLLPVGPRAADVALDCAAERRWSAPNQRPILALQYPIPPMSRELLGETGVSAIGLGDNEEPGRFLVEAMDDSRTLNAADAGEALATMRD